MAGCWRVKDTIKRILNEFSFKRETEGVNQEKENLEEEKKHRALSVHLVATASAEEENV